MPLLSAVQSRIFALLGFPSAIYQVLGQQSAEVGAKIDDP